LSPYNFAANSPSNFIDADGNDEIHFYILTTKINLGGPTPYTTAKYLMPVIVKTDGADRFFYHNITKIHYTATVPNSTTETDDITEFFPGLFPITYSGITETPSDIIPFWDNDDPDFVALAKLINICPSVGDYLRQHDPNKYNAVLIAAEELKKKDEAEKFAIPILIALETYQGLRTVSVKGRGLWLGAAEFGSDEATLKSFNNLKSKVGWYDVVVHGDGYYVGYAFNVDGKAITAEQLYQRMLESGYKQGTSIRLISCNAASGPLAQDLSNLAKAKVIAPAAKTKVVTGGKILTEDGSKFQVFEPKK